MRFAYLEVINLSGRMFFVLFAKLGHQTMTFVASEQRLRKHMNTTTLSTTTTTTKRQCGVLRRPITEPDLPCFSFRLQLQETLPSEFSRDFCY